MRPRAMSAGREWEDYDSWFRLRLETDLQLEEIEAEKISRFILSLFLNQENEIDYKREKELFKYSKTSPNSRSTVLSSRDYIDGKSAMEMAVDELFSIASLDWPDEHIYELITGIVTHLKTKIDAGRRKRKISESQSVGSSRSCSSSSSSYEDEFPPINGNGASNMSYEISSWVEKPTEKEEISEYLPLPQYRFAFKNPKSGRDQSRKRSTQKKPKKTNKKKDSENQKQELKNNKVVNDISPKKKEKTRKRKRPRKKKTDEVSISPQPSMARQVESLDNFSSLDEALDFLKDMSASSEEKDAKIWQKVMKDQHVKYVNGSFFFTPRIKNLDMNNNRPIKKDAPDQLLDQAASTALSTVLKLIDDDNEQNSDILIPNVASFPINVSKNKFESDLLWPSLQSLSIWTQKETIDWNYT